MHSENIFILEESSYQEIERTIDLKKIEIDGNISTSEPKEEIIDVDIDLSNLQFFYELKRCRF